MALKAKLTTLDGLNDAIKAEYRQDGDHFVLDVTPVEGFALEDISGLKSTLQKKNTEVTDLKGKLKGFEVDGVVVDSASALAALAKIKELGNLTPEQLAEQKVKIALEQANTQFNTQLSAKDGEIKGLLGNLEAVMIDQTATAALAAKGGNVKLLLPHVKQSLRMVKTDKGYDVNVVDAEGNARIHVEKGKTSSMTLEQFVDEMSASDDFATAFKAPGVSGAGSKEPKKIGTNGVKVVDANDAGAVNGSIADIASGKVQVAFS